MSLREQEEATYSPPASVSICKKEIQRTSFTLCMVQRGCTGSPPCTAPRGAFPTTLQADSSLELVSIQPMWLCAAAPGVEAHHTPTLIFKERAQSAPQTSHSLKTSEQPSTFCTPFKAGLASCKANLGPTALEINAKYVESSLIFQGFGRGNLPNLWHK